MTIQTTSTKVQYGADGLTNDFPFGFETLSAATIEVYENGVLSTAAIVITLNQFQFASPGGNVNIIPAPLATVTVTIRRVNDLTQLRDYVTGGSFPAESHEEALDVLTATAQQLKEEIDRKLGAGAGDNGGTDFEIPAYSARRALVWDVTLRKLVNSTVDPDEQSNVAAASAAASAASAAASAASAVASDASFALANAEANSAQSSRVVSDANAIASGNSATAAASSESNAASSAAAASNSATTASGAATNAGTSESNAGTSATTASSAASAAGTSATNAGTSESNAGTSATAAASSATAAASSAASAGAAAGIIINFPVTGGTTIAYTATLGIGSYVSGTTYRIRINAENSSSTNTTLNLDGLGAKTVRTIDGVIIAQGHMKANAVGEFYYNGAEFFLINPAKLTVVFRVNGTGTELASITGTQQLLMSVKAIDTHNFYDNVTNFRFTPKVAGYYSITAQIMWFSVASTDGVILFLYQNGAQISESFAVASSNTEINNITRVVFFNGTTDYIDIRAQNFARDTSSLQISGIQTWFEGHLV